jgi:hypothetical protein
MLPKPPTYNMLVERDHKNVILYCIDSTTMFDEDRQMNQSIFKKIVLSFFCTVLQNLYLINDILPVKEFGDVSV